MRIPPVHDKSILSKINWHFHNLLRTKFYVVSIHVITRMKIKFSNKIDFFIIFNSYRKKSAKIYLSFKLFNWYHGMAFLKYKKKVNDKMTSCKLYLPPERKSRLAWSLRTLTDASSISSSGLGYQGKS